MSHHKVPSIPRIIHYCWFGGGAKPKIVQQCMLSWQKQLAEYTIMEWNETNVDLKSNAYVEEAYRLGKYAFVSDYVRLHALHEHGGIYLDTDVEVFKPFDDLLQHASFWGFEQGNYIATSTIGAMPRHPVIRSFLDLYSTKSFIKADGSVDTYTNVAEVTRLLEGYGLQRNGLNQALAEGVIIYEQTYFSPYDYIHCRSMETEHTYAKHHFYKSWLPLHVRIKGIIKKMIALLIGGHNLARLRNLRTKA